MWMNLSTQVNAVPSTANLNHLSSLVVGFLFLMLSGCHMTNQQSREQNTAEAQVKQTEILEIQATDNSSEQPLKVLKQSTREEPAAPKIKQGEHTLVKPIDKPWPPQPDPKPVLEEKPRKDSI
ncbi:hypothetical protein [Shewanella aquimarina]|uniref:hypothetical protein n=1 Tax=Shewanella aquimarina TaxID=260365 RepID=UPI002014DF35|nr:hypothetical protein [Shewanella aquimarina]MCL2910513.1 hypothetical protein [Shewanella aquimarina]